MSVQKKFLKDIFNSDIWIISIWTSCGTIQGEIGS